MNQVFEVDGVRIALWQIALAGGLLGLICGLLPLILGRVRKKNKLGLIGFVVCILIGLPFSLLGALPAAIIFAILILRSRKDLPAEDVNVKI